MDPDLDFDLGPAPVVLAPSWARVAFMWDGRDDDAPGGGLIPLLVVGLPEIAQDVILERTRDMAMDELTARTGRLRVDGLLGPSVCAEVFSPDGVPLFDIPLELTVLLGAGQGWHPSPDDPHGPATVRVVAVDADDHLIARGGGFPPDARAVLEVFLDPEPIARALRNSLAPTALRLIAGEAL